MARDYVSMSEVKLNSPGIRKLLRSHELADVIKKEYTSKVASQVQGAKIEMIMRNTRIVQAVVVQGRSLYQLRKDGKHTELLRALQSTGAKVNRMKFETRVRRNIKNRSKAAYARKAQQKRRS